MHRLRRWATIGNEAEAYLRTAVNNGKRGCNQFIFLVNRSRERKNGNRTWLKARNSYQLVGHNVSEGVVGC